MAGERAHCDKCQNHDAGGADRERGEHWGSRHIFSGSAPTRFSAHSLTRGSGAERRQALNVRQTLAFR
jgi:hypothetical protein